MVQETVTPTAPNKPVPNGVGQVLGLSWKFLVTGFVHYLVASLILLWGGAIIAGLVLVIPFIILASIFPDNSNTAIIVAGVIVGVPIILILSGWWSGAILSLFKIQWEGSRPQWKEGIRLGRIHLSHMVKTVALQQVVMLGVTAPGAAGSLLLQRGRIGAGFTWSFIAFILTITIFFRFRLMPQAAILDDVPAWKTTRASLRAASNAEGSVWAPLIVGYLLNIALSKLSGYLPYLVVYSVALPLVTVWEDIALGLAYVQGTRREIAVKDAVSDQPPASND